MSGLFGVVSKRDCVQTLFYGTDYHSHLGTQKAGLVVLNQRLQRSIHDISTSQFKSKFIDELPNLKGAMGIGVISDSDPQPIIISSSFGNFAVVLSGLLENKINLAKEIMAQGGSFSELSGGKINSVEVIGKMIAQKKDIVSGIEYLFSKMKGSASLLVLAKQGIYAARDYLGRTPLVIGQKGNSWAVTSETCAFPNLGFEVVKELMPGEIVLLSKKGFKERKKGDSKKKICAFLWIYTGYPASSYEGISVEAVRERCGVNLAKGDKIKPDLVTGVPDSGIAHALGYAMASGVPYRRPLVKYTAGYGRSYTPPSQEIRDRVAQMKLIPIKTVVKDKSIVICDDSIVRGTQLKNQAIKKLWHHGATKIHVRIACPPLMFPCRFCLSTRTKKELAARRAIRKAFKKRKKKLDNKQFLDEKTPAYQKMVDTIRKELGVTSLKYQSIQNMVKAIGLPKDKLCLYCWNGEED
ncbi:MAG TPA: amidophosphoribosyltransferase [Nevskiaceae bacterium]|nr:amidophosphoribosyltransferase [Nevskiaceae bacterium]